MNDKAFGHNIVDASDALYKASLQISEAISSLECARNQAKTDESFKQIDTAQAKLTHIHNEIEKLRLNGSDFTKLFELYGDNEEELL